MNQEHRDTIDLYSDVIIPRINWVDLWPKLLENKLFNRDDVNISRWAESLVDEETVKDVYSMIKTRGPFAFQRFVYSLRETGHDDLADILEGKRTVLSVDNIPNNEDDRDPDREIDTFFHNMQLADEPLRIRVKKSTEFLDGPIYKTVPRYPMRSNPRGLVLLITNIYYKYVDESPRISAEHDETNLTQLFQQMGFRVVSFRDLTGQDLLDKVKEFSQREDLRKVDSCFVIISSHGSMNEKHEDTEIQGIDYHPSAALDNYKTVLCMDIMDCFTAESCPRLAGKPKVFIFQLCRGSKSQKSIKEPRHTTDTINIPAKTTTEIIDHRMNNKTTMRNYSDMLIAHATMPGHVAFRDKITGSWFIQILCEVFMNYANTTHIQDLFNIVDSRLDIQRTTKEECQTLTLTMFGFNKHCYLNPGLFEET